MSNETANNLFIVPPFAIKHAGFYQELLRGVVSHQQLGNRLIQLAEQAHAFRQFDKVKEIGQILFNFPLKQYSSIGAYFLGVAFNSCGNGDQDEAKRMFELVADTAPDRYKAKAILSLAAVSFNTKDYDTALYFYNETIRVSGIDSASIQAIRTIAILKGMQGNHRAALKDLENLCLLIKHAPAHIYFDCLNSLAVELGAAGYKQEARNIMRFVLTSPYAFAYPEWRETAEELREPNRSFVAVPLIEREHVKIEKTEIKHASKPEPPPKVIPFKLKEAPPPQKPDKLSTQEYAGMSISDKKEMILAAVKSGAINEDDYYKMMIMLGLITIGPSDKILDLEDEETLDDIAVIWATHVGPDNFAAVLSVLRDCDDSLRRNEIIDRMIKKAFQQTHLSGLTEEAWRLRVERRLPEK